MSFLKLVIRFPYHAVVFEHHLGWGKSHRMAGWEKINKEEWLWRKNVKESLSRSTLKPVITFHFCQRGTTKRCYFPRCVLFAHSNESFIYFRSLNSLLASIWTPAVFVRAVTSDQKLQSIVGAAQHNNKQSNKRLME